MQVLLDTHAFLWWLDGDSKLPVSVREIILEEENTVYISAASVWEITTKVRIGKLPGATAVRKVNTHCLALLLRRRGRVPGHRRRLPLPKARLSDRCSSLADG